jgi:hypothetical protein
MKGTLHKTEQGWMVSRCVGDGVAEVWEETIPLHPDNVDQINRDAQIFDNIEARIAASPEVEFEIVIDANINMVTQYAKLITQVPDVRKMVEDDVEKLAEEEYPISKGGSMWMPTSFDLDQSCRQEGFINGYNKAKETLYTEEQVREIVEKSRATGLTAEYIMLSLKQTKKD